MSLRQGPFARGDALPHIAIETIDGDLFRYVEVWQQRNLVLISVPDGLEEDAYISQVRDARPELSARDAVAVITRESIEGLTRPGVLIVDRWGRVIHAAHAGTAAALPPIPDVLAWLDYIQMRCG